MGSFQSQWQAQLNQVHQRLDIAIRRIALEVYVRVQQKTPVDSGALRRSWTVGINAMPSNYNGDRQALQQIKYGDVVIIGTDKRYAPYLEYGLYPNPPKRKGGKTKNGYSVQAPKGMVRISVAELKSWLANNPPLGELL